MGSIDKGKKINVRWSKKRIKSVQRLGWEDLDEGAALNRAFERAETMDELAYKLDQAFRGKITLLELISQLNNVRQLK